MAKLLENTYRHVNIALVNEMAIFCRELDVDLWDAIRCAATKPFGFQPFYPGPGVGGHCIPIDPNYLSYKVRTLGYPFRFVELAQEINGRMPGYVTERAAELLNRNAKPVNGARVLLLGVTYKKDIADQRESPARPIARRLRRRGAAVSFHDPYVPQWQVDGEAVPRAESLGQALAEADLTILLQPHACYDPARIARTARLLLDTRGVVPRTPCVEALLACGSWCARSSTIPRTRASITGRSGPCSTPGTRSGTSPRPKVKSLFIPNEPGACCRSRRSLARRAGAGSARCWQRAGNWPGTAPAPTWC
jgi:UDP-N-acetyl-D-mannosaminuronate dehydrogenase